MQLRAKSPEPDKTVNRAVQSFERNAPTFRLSALDSQLSTEFLRAEVSTDAPARLLGQSRRGRRNPPSGFRRRSLSGSMTIELTI
jgi:hypothetical protein